MPISPDRQAIDLLADVGVHEAWHRATGEAIAAHLAQDTGGRDFWQAVQQELRRIAPRPGAGEHDIDAKARMLVALHGNVEALVEAQRELDRASGDLIQEAYWARVLAALRPAG